MRIRPSVGSVILLRIFSRVDLPAPFRPIMPTTSPCLTLNDTSLSAQKFSTEPLNGGQVVMFGHKLFPSLHFRISLAIALNGATACWEITSRKVVYRLSLLLWRRV